MILQSAMARIRREGGLIDILLFFSHEMFIKAFRQIVKLFERTNIFSRKFDKRKKLAAACRTHAAQRVEDFAGRGVPECAEPPSGFMASSHMLHTEAKKEAPLRGPPSVNQGNCSVRIY